MPISWELYLKIRKISLKKFINSKKIKNYEELISYLNKEDVIFPTPKEVSSFFPVKKIKKVAEKTEVDVKKIKVDTEKNKVEDFSFEDLGAYDPLQENVTVENTIPLTKDDKIEDSDFEEKVDIPKRKPRRRKKRATKKSSSKK
jgi:hypothetical protein